MNPLRPSYPWLMRLNLSIQERWGSLNLKDTGFWLDLSYDGVDCHANCGFLEYLLFRSAQIKDRHIVLFLSSVESRCLSERSFKRFIQYFPAWNLTLHQHGKHESIDWDFAEISKTFYLITLDFKVIYHVLSRSFDSIIWTSQFFGFHLSLHLLFLSLTCDI